MTVAAAAREGTKRSLRTLALSVHFRQPDFGMKSHEILSRATAFLLAVDPPYDPLLVGPSGAAAAASAGKSGTAGEGPGTDGASSSSISSMLEKSESDRALRKLKQHYRPDPAGGPPRDVSELGWLEFCPTRHRPVAHCVAASHVVAPWMWKNYYPHDWLKNVGLEHCSYSLDVYDPEKPDEALAKFALNPSPIHHPRNMDLAIMHLKDEESALKHIQGLGVELLHLRHDQKAFERGEEVLFDGFEVAEDNMTDQEMLDSSSSRGERSKKEDDDTRVFFPFTETGSLIFASPERFLAETSRPLPEGLCGGPVIDSDGRVCGVVEGIVPLDHEDKRLAGAAAFLPSSQVRGFLDWAERLMLETIVPKKLYDKVVDLKKGKALNEDAEEFEPPSDLDLDSDVVAEGEEGSGGGDSGSDDHERSGDVIRDQAESLGRAYDEMVESLKKNYSAQEVEAILATVEREKQEVIDTITREGGELDEIIAKVRRRTREQQRKILEEAEAALIQEAEVISETADKPDRAAGGKA